MPTIKRLFAHSGNRCAFPRCTAPLIDGATVVGEVCHIKGVKPGSARYDAQQPADERHGFDNLILMCSRHHTVIDDDEGAYTVEHLVRMKTDHESRANPVGEDFAEKAAQLLINRSVTSMNQSGGINAQTVNVFAQTSRLRERQIDALVKLGDDLRKMLDYLQSMTRSVGFERELSKDEYVVLYEKAATSACTIFSEIRLLIPHDLADECERFFRSAIEGRFNFDMARQPSIVDGNQRATFWKRAGTIAYQELPGILERVEQGARGLIHGP